MPLDLSAPAPTGPVTYWMNALAAAASLLAGPMPAEADTAINISGSGYVKVPDAADLRPSQLTLEAWV